MYNRKRFRLLIIIAITLGFCTGVLFAEEDTATLSIMIGTVEYCPSGTETWEEATEGMKLSAGDKIRTGIDGMLSILFSNRSSVTLKQETEFKIQSLKIAPNKEDIAFKLQLTRGRLRAKIEELGDESSFEIMAPTAVAAVRGTTFYLNVREVAEDELPPDVKERLVTELFVEVGGVIYTNTLSGKYYAVSAGQASDSYGDGGVTEPLEIPEDMQQEWLEGWDDILAAEPYQDPEGGDPDLGDDTGDGGDTGDTGGNRQSDLLGQLLKEIHEQDEKNIIWQEIVSKLTEREWLRGEIRDILTANNDRRLEGYIEKISDAQMAKVLTDVHGRRVRVEQYVLRPEPDVIELLNVNLRGNTSGGDLTTMEWTTRFNQSLDDLPSGGIKDLPWEYYLNTQYVRDALEHLGDFPEDMTIGEMLEYMEVDMPDDIAEILGEVEDMPIAYFEDMPIFIFSPQQVNDIYPEEMCVKFSHNDDAFAETRLFGEIFSLDDFYDNGRELTLMMDNGFDEEIPELGIQIIEMQSLFVKGFNSDEPMMYVPALPEIGQLPGTYSIEKGLPNATIGGAENNPLGFRYDFVSSGGASDSIDAAFYVISDDGTRQDDYGGDGPDTIWDVLGVNMEDDDMRYDGYDTRYDNNYTEYDDGYIGDYNVEMIFGSPSLFTSGPIDLIYIPAPNMDWKDEIYGDKYIPDYSEEIED